MEEEEERVVVTSLRARGGKKAAASAATVRPAFDDDEADINPRANAAIKKALKKKKKGELRAAQSGAADFDMDGAYDFSTDFVEVNPMGEDEEDM
jgi:hypothetical protein